MEFESNINTIIITISSLAALWFLYRTKTVNVYKDAVQAYEIRLNQLENDLKSLKTENKDLNALVNQLKGENKTLQDIVVKPDSEFKEIVKVILDEIKIINQHQSDIREDFIQHSKNDDKRFRDIGEYAKSNNSLLKKMNKE